MGRLVWEETSILRVEVAGISPSLVMASMLGQVEE